MVGWAWKVFGLVFSARKHERSLENVAAFRAFHALLWQHRAVLPEELGEFAREAATRLLVTHRIKLQTRLRLRKIMHECAHGADEYRVANSVLDAKYMELNHDLLRCRASLRGVRMPEEEWLLR